MKNKVSILGTEYRIFIDAFNDPELAPKNRAGYCFFLRAEIHLENLDTDPNWEGETEETKRIYFKRLLRHEIIHAFLYESGLSDDSSGISAWARNEEMVDWIALQAPKLIVAFKEVETDEDDIERRLIGFRRAEE